MLVIAAPAWSLIRVMWYSNGPGNDSNCHPKSEPQNSRPFAVSSAGISTCTGWPGMISPLVQVCERLFNRHHMTGASPRPMSSAHRGGPRTKTHRREEDRPMSRVVVNEFLTLDGELHPLVLGGGRR